MESLAILADMSVKVLHREYPDAACSLRYDSPLQLLISARLAAQCTDERVNRVTSVLFERFKSARDFAQADISVIEQYIRPCGFYRVKARDIVSFCQKICDDFAGDVPNNMSDLLSLPGIGRKTANLILGDVFNMPAIVVDTHCMRVTRRLGFHTSKDPEKVEKILRALLNPNESNAFCHRLVFHGRKVCKAINPRCSVCAMRSFCNEYKKRSDT